jgi:hypothetical protein
MFTVANLSPVPLETFDVITFAYILFSVVVVLDFLASIPMVLFEFPEESLPNLFPSIVVQRIVTDRNVYSRHESFVELTNSVCCEENNSFKIIQCAQEN